MEQRTFFLTFTQMAPGQSSKDFVGPSVWTVLHSYAAAFAPHQRRSFVALVKELTELFPCQTCKENFKKKLLVLPLENYLGSNHDLFFWTYTMHDLVNQADPVHRKVSPPYDKAKYIYFGAMKENCDDCFVVP